MLSLYMLPQLLRVSKPFTAFWTNLIPNLFMDALHMPIHLLPCLAFKVTLGTFEGFDAFVDTLYVRPQVTPLCECLPALKAFVVPDLFVD